MRLRCPSEFKFGVLVPLLVGHIRLVLCPTGWTSRSLLPEPSVKAKADSDFLSWTCAPLQSNAKHRAAVSLSVDDRVVDAAPPMRFLPLQRFPAQGSGMLWPGLPRPTALRLQVFTTS
jgi:hypothetical protein